MLNNVYKLFFSRLFLFKGRSNRKEYIVTYGNEDTLFSFLYVISLGSIGILMFLQYFPLAVRRFHDLNASGWWVLLSFLPFGQVIILWLMFKKGTSGINKYGEEPLN